MPLVFVVTQVQPSLSVMINEMFSISKSDRFNNMNIHLYTSVITKHRKFVYLYEVIELFYLFSGEDYVSV